MIRWQNSNIQTFFPKETSKGTEKAKREEKSKATIRNQNAEVVNNVETSDNLLIFSLILKVNI